MKMYAHWFKDVEPKSLEKLSRTLLAEASGSKVVAAAE